MVDLPLPERPMMTKVCPFCTSKDTSCRPITAPNSDWISALLFSRFSGCNALSGFLPKTFQMESTLIMGPWLPLSLRSGLVSPVTSKSVCSAMVAIS